jgi:hypothetical protein
VRRSQLRHERDQALKLAAELLAALTARDREYSSPQDQRLVARAQAFISRAGARRNEDG